MNVSMQIVQSPGMGNGVATDKIEGAHENKRSRAGVLFRALANLESQKPRGKQIAYIWFKCICFREKKTSTDISLWCWKYNEFLDNFCPIFNIPQQ